MSSEFVLNPKTSLLKMTETELDKLVEMLDEEQVLPETHQRRNSSRDTLSADAFTFLVVDAIIATGLEDNQTLAPEDVLVIKTWINQNYFTNLTASSANNSEINTLTVNPASVSTSATQVTSIPAYSQAGASFNGTTGTGLDQLVKTISGEPGLAGANQGQDLHSGALAADSLNHIIADAILATGAGVNHTFTTQDVLAINTWIRQNRLSQFTSFYGTDNGTSETGFRLVQNDGAITNYRDLNLVDTVADGIYHLGFQVQNGVFLNADGTANASVAQVADWLTQFYTDRATTNTGLDRLPELILADSGLANSIPWENIAGGTDSANGIDQLYATAISTLNLATDGNISESDILAINNWIRSDANRYASFVALHGNDQGSVETGFHLVKNDGANTIYFGRNLVNAVADGMYHIGFEVQNGNFLNEDGNTNASVKDVADWVNYFYADQSDTNTGLDQIVDIIKIDPGLSQFTNAGDINQGASAANELNHLIVEAIQQTNTNSDGWITKDDLRVINAWVRANDYDQFVALHGNDENGVSSGFHLVKGNGGIVQFFGEDLIDTVADSMYHIGFSISGNNFLNEDGSINATLSDVASEYNYFYSGKTVIPSTKVSDTLIGTDQSDHIFGDDGNDTINGGNSSDLLEGNAGDDVLNGEAGDDLLYGDNGNDSLNGGEGSDRYMITGIVAVGESSFQGYDTYADTGSTGIDRIIANWSGPVDIGLLNFSAASGIEIIDTTGVAGTVRLLGDWNPNRLDFSSTQLIGTNIQIDGGSGNDTLTGSQGDDVLIGGVGDDALNGSGGSDRYLVTGYEPAGTPSFQGYNTYTDTGSTGTDRLIASGVGAVDIGLSDFSATGGIEIIDGTGATGTVRLLGNWNPNRLDFSKTQFVGTNFQIDGGSGNDTLTGSQGDDVLIGGVGDDALNGAGGSDRYLVTGYQSAGNPIFQGYNTYTDTGSVGTDRLIASGVGAVDIGLSDFSATGGIEIIDGTGATGTVRLLGNGNANRLDFSNTQFIGTNIQIDGGNGDDTLVGSTAKDTILGGSGNDNLTGGSGADQLTGGSGQDRFIFVSSAEIGLNGSPQDTIVDFSKASDSLDLGSIDANRLLSGDQSFVYLAGGAFTGNAGELRLASGILSGDTNGDKVSDFDLIVTGVTTLTSSNLVL